MGAHAVDTDHMSFAPDMRGADLAPIALDPRWQTHRIIVVISIVSFVAMNYRDNRAIHRIFFEQGQPSLERNVSKSFRHKNVKFHGKDDPC